MEFIIDSFKGEYVVIEIENGTTIDIPKKLLPEGALEGDVLEVVINRDKTKARKERIEKLCEDMWE